MSVRGGIKVAPREAAPSEEEPKAPVPSVLTQALGDGASVLPWKDLGKPARPRLLLYGALAPIWMLVIPKLAETLLAMDELPIGNRAVAAILVATAILGPIFTPSAAAFALSAVFHGLQGDGTRSRLRQALVCPYCRDSVGREGTVICARNKCGALYHRECWEECAKQYGGCAVYGCSAKKCREVTAAGFLIRIARLLLAAALFPPRAVRAIRNNETESALSIYRRAVAASKSVYFWTNASSGRQAFFVLLLGIPLSYAILFGGALLLGYRDLGEVKNPLIFVLMFAIILGGPFLMLALPYLVAIPVVFTFFFALAVKRALEAEFSALERADQGGGTVLGRLAAGFGKK